MLRLQSNEKQTFAATLKASSQELEAALRQRRREMDQAWDNVDQGWKGLQQGMAEVGITKPCDANERMVRLNVGGSPVNVRRSVLDGKGGSSSSGWTLGNTFEARWDERLPVDKDGRLVLDESPIAVKHLIHTLLTGSAAAEGAGELTADEKPYLPFVSRALGLTISDPTAMETIAVSGGSTILGPAMPDASKAALQSWFPGEELELMYRATRDGWTPGGFHSRCGDSSRTVSLFQIGTSVVGGFSSVPWLSGGFSTPSPSPGAFVFMLMDGAGSGQQPAKWGIKNKTVEHCAVFRGDGFGPCFGHDGQCPYIDLASVVDGRQGILYTNNRHYNIPDRSSMLDLHERYLTEIEVFRVSPTVKVAPPPNAELPALEESDAPVVMPTQREDDVRQFGALIAGSLMEERMALRDAEIELVQARAKVSATTNALEAVYGPDIAAGKEDPVVELSARGTRMTTLRSTLLVCSDSALATRFDETKWPANEKDVDEHGRRVIDCSPAVFSKVLDVLRMRKRSAWTGGKGVQMVRVAVKAGDREAFEEFVNMQFPGCESFVMDYVDVLEKPQSGR